MFAHFFPEGSVQFAHDGTCQSKRNLASQISYSIPRFRKYSAKIRYGGDGHLSRFAVVSLEWRFIPSRVALKALSQSHAGSVTHCTHESGNLKASLPLSCSYSSGALASGS